jgi:hypothetical protein
MTDLKADPRIAAMVDHYDYYTSVTSHRRRLSNADGASLVFFTESSFYWYKSVR